MAKILFFNVPAYGHVNPTLPVVTELVRRGHQIVYYNAETFAPVLEGTGVDFRSYPDSAIFEVEFTRRINNLVTVSVLLLEESLRLLPFALAQIEAEMPNVVVFDALALWGMQAARLKKVASVASFGLFVLEGVPNLITWRDYIHIFRQAFRQLPAIQRLRRQLVKTYGAEIFPGKSILPCRGDQNIVYTSREFQPETPFIDKGFHFVGPSILATTRKESDFPWGLLEAKRNKVYISLGTLYNTNLDFYHTLFAAFANHPAQFILSIGRQTKNSDLGSTPANFLIQSSVPQLELLQKVDLFITHGGMNSINEALYYAVPMVIVPQQIEQALNGRLVSRHGAGIILADKPPYGKPDDRRLQQAVATVLADPTYRQHAARLRQSFQNAGGYQEAANVISFPSTSVD